MFKLSVYIYLIGSASFIWSATLTSNCINESGATNCQIKESGDSLMSLSCTNDESSCTGKYFTQSTKPVNFTCSADREAFYFKCSGGVGHDRFSLYCGPAQFEFGKFACSITDSSGTSVSVMCDMLSGTGMPSCNGVDNNGISHKIQCITNESGINSCSIS